MSYAALITFRTTISQGILGHSQERWCIVPCFILASITWEIGWSLCSCVSVVRHHLGVHLWDNPFEDFNSSAVQVSRSAAFRETWLIVCTCSEAWCLKSDLRTHNKLHSTSLVPTILKNLLYPYTPSFYKIHHYLDSHGSNLVLPHRPCNHTLRALSLRLCSFSQR